MLAQVFAWPGVVRAAELIARPNLAGAAWRRKGSVRGGWPSRFHRPTRVPQLIAERDSLRLAWRSPALASETAPIMGLQATASIANLQGVAVPPGRQCAHPGRAIGLLANFLRQAAGAVTGNAVA